MIICAYQDLMRYAPVVKGLEEAIETINGLTEFENGKVYPLSGENRIIIFNGQTSPVERAEAHREFLDVQCILKGKEVMGWADVAKCRLDGEFDTQKDVGWYEGDIQFIDIPAGYCYIVYPEDVHMPCRHLDAPTEVVKAIVKLKV